MSCFSKSALYAAGSIRSQLLEVFGERFQPPCWLSDDEHLARCRTHIVPRVRDELGSIDARAWLQMKDLIAHLNVVLAFQGIEPLTLNMVDVQRRTGVSLGSNLKHGESSAVIPARYFHGDLAIRPASAGRH